LVRSNIEATFTLLAKRLIICLAAALLSTLLLAGFGSVWAWSNGGYSNDPAHPDYGTHDWIAQHALDWLPTHEKQFLTENIASYLYGTELPDNKDTPGGVGDATSKHHIYFFSNGTIQDDASAVRAREEYVAAQQAFAAGNLSSAAMHLGMVTHYIDDMGVFGHMMGTPTAWGTESHHTDYEDYVLTRTNTYTDDFNGFLAFDGNLSTISAYDAAVMVARETTFDGASGLTCKWMDQNYNWTEPTFKNRVGESLNLATNAVADTLHTFYTETFTQTSPTPVIPEFSAAASTALVWALAFASVCFAVHVRNKGAKT